MNCNLVSIWRIIIFIAWFLIGHSDKTPKPQHNGFELTTIEIITLHEIYGIWLTRNMENKILEHELVSKGD